MTHAKLFRLASASTLLVALGAGLPAQAQSSSTPTSTTTTSTTTSADSYSLVPYTRSGYAGINLGKSEWDAGCGAGFTCGDPGGSVYVYTGGLISEVLGLELGYTNTGSANRHGGRTRAHGLNLSLVLRAPLGSFNVFAKAGALYGQTRVSADPASGIATGRRTGWGGTYGVGVGYDFTPRTGMVLEVTRNEFRMPGGGRDNLDTVSLGLLHRF